MRPGLAAIALPLALGALAEASPRPTHAALRKAFEANRATVVQVRGPRGTGPGVMVGADGHVVTSVDYSGLEAATVKLGEQELPARVLLANAKLGVVVLQLETPGAFRAAAVRLDATFSKGDWLVGVARRRDGSLEPTAGQVFSGPSAESPFVETDLPVPSGSPLFDAQGRLVAVIVKRRGRLSSRALPMAAIKLTLAKSEATEARE